MSHTCGWIPDIVYNNDNKPQAIQGINLHVEFVKVKLNTVLFLIIFAVD